MTYAEVEVRLRDTPRSWLVTGAAGFIGSHLVQYLLSIGQRVVGLDNFSTGSLSNLHDVQACVGEHAWTRFSFLEGDIRDLGACRAACAGVDVVLHQAALGSVPRSLEDPVTTNASNVTGTLNMLVAASDARIERFVYAASSSTYGDHPALPKREENIGRPLSPYAVTKYVAELYADVFHRTYGLETIGLRYFNVFGARQDPEGAYAAVIPRWITSLLHLQPCRIHGDGETSRDFCYVANVVQANVLAATVEEPTAMNQVYNVACGERTTLNELFSTIRTELSIYDDIVSAAKPVYDEFRQGDVRHSLAEIAKARTRLGYAPDVDVVEGLRRALPWYVERWRSAGRHPATTRRPSSAATTGASGCR